MAFGSELAGFRRRDRLSQLALAERSGVSQRHISFLESGRSRPGSRSVERLARALNLNYADANALFASAGLTRPRPVFNIEDAEFEPARRTIELMLEKHAPYPAVATLRSGEVILSNQPFRAAIEWAFGGETPWRSTPSSPDNLFELTLHPDGLRRFMENPQEIVPHTFRRLRAAARDDSGAQRALCRIRTACGDDPLAALAEPAAAAASSVLIERYQVRSEPLNLVSMVASFGSPEDVTAQTLQVEMFFPHDEDTVATLKRLSPPKHGV